jgi:hypothetical protein
MPLLLAAAATPAQAYQDYSDDGYSSGGYDGGGSSFSTSGGGGRLGGRDSRGLNPYLLSTGGGVAAPSMNGAVGENPAGLIYNRRVGVLGYVATTKNHPELLANGFAFQGGNGLAAASVGIQNVNNATDENGNITSFTIGMSTYAEQMNVAFGLTGAYRFKKQGKAIDPKMDSTWGADLGMLYNPYGAVQLGASLYGLSEGLTAASVGAAAHINSVSKISIDASVNNAGRGLTVKPGIAVQAKSLSLSYAYGMQVDESAASGITRGNTLGLGYNFTPAFRMTGYFNHYATYYMGANIDLF